MSNDPNIVLLNSQKSVAFYGIPFPISENKMRRAFARGSRLAVIKSEAARDYEHEFQMWAIVNKKRLLDAGKMFHGKRLYVGAIYYCEFSRMYTKKGSPKRFDLLNLQKIMIDCLFQNLGIDDSMIFTFAAKKMVSDKEGVDVFLSTILDQNEDALGALLGNNLAPE